MTEQQGWILIVAVVVLGIDLHFIYKRLDSLWSLLYDIREGTPGYMAKREAEKLGMRYP